MHLDEESTEAYLKDMFRIGKEDQLKRRVFRGFSTICLTSMVQATWEVAVVANSQGLVNGGRAGLFWSFIWTWCGFLPIVLSLAEIASMAPTSGGQYHWISEFSPPRYQQFMSYMSGWLATTSWQAGSAGGSFLASSLIQALIIAYDDSYVPQPYYLTLLFIAMACIYAFFNLLIPEYLPAIETAVAFVHGLAWIPVVVILAVLAQRASAKEVFLTFESSGWSPIGLSVMVGQITAVYFLIRMYFLS